MNRRTSPGGLRPEYRHTPVESSPEGSAEQMALPKVICLCGPRGAPGIYPCPSNSKPPPCTPYPGHSTAE